MTETSRRNLYVEDSMWQRARVAAARHGVSVSEYIRRALKKKVEADEKRVTRPRKR